MLVKIGGSRSEDSSSRPRVVQAEAVVAHVRLETVGEERRGTVSKYSL